MNVIDETEALNLVSPHLNSSICSYFSKQASWCCCLKLDKLFYTISQVVCVYTLHSFSIIKLWLFVSFFREIASAIKKLLDAVNDVSAYIPGSQGKQALEQRKREFVKYSKRFSNTLKEYFKEGQ